MSGVSRVINATEWLCCDNEEEDQAFHDDNDDCIVVYPNSHYYCVTLSPTGTLGRRKIVEDSDFRSDYKLDSSIMAPVTTFCATPANNNPNLHFNNLNRAKSLDNLNFLEKRQLIASTLSLADILHQGGYYACVFIFVLIC